MNPKEVFKFCPKCGGKLIKKEGNLLDCSKCGFHFYINPLPCNGVIIENDKGEIMLVKRKFEPKKGYWDWPGGFINSGESLEDSVKREIKEELGVDVGEIEIVGVYEDRYLYQDILDYTICIAVSAKITGGSLKVSDDISGYKYFSKEEIFRQNFAFPSIKQGVSDYLTKKGRNR